MMYRFSEQARTNNRYKQNDSHSSLGQGDNRSGRRVGSAAGRRPVTSCNSSEKNDDRRRTVAVRTRTPIPSRSGPPGYGEGQSQLRVSERLTKLTGFPLSGIEIADTGAVNAWVVRQPEPGEVSVTIE